MNSRSSTTDPMVLELTYEHAYDEIERLKDRTKKETSGVVLYTGHHPEFGHVHIIIPAMGNGMMMINSLPAEWQPKPVMMSVIEDPE